MFRKLMCLTSFVLVLGLVGYVQAQDISWSDATGDHNWFTEANWDLGILPTSEGITSIESLPGPIIAYNEGAVAYAGRVYIVNGALTVDGGTLLVNTWLNIAQSGTGTLNMYSGTLQTLSNFSVGNAGSAILNMTGGTINIARTMQIPEKATATGHAKLHGGIINANDINVRPTAGGVGTIDMRAATLIINGDKLAKVQGYIDQGWITAYDGDGTLKLDYDVTNPGKTTVKGVHYLKPNPIDGGSVVHGALELSWTLPDPCVAGEPVLVDVYFTDDWEALYSFTDPAAIQVVSMQDVNSIVVQSQPKVKYYWAVDTYIGGDDPNNNPILGPIFSFTAVNQAPKVDAGPDLLTWPGEDGTRTKDLDATVTDQDAYTVMWTVISEPNDPNNPDAVIADPSAEDTSITLSALGEYVLQLDASDGEKTGSDTVTINVYNDGCEAAQSLPDYVPVVGDLNGDCKVNDVDLALLQENWLKDNSLTEP